MSKIKEFTTATEATIEIRKPFHRLVVESDDKMDVETFQLSLNGVSSNKTNIVPSGTKVIHSAEYTASDQGVFINKDDFSQAHILVTESANFSLNGDDDEVFTLELKNLTVANTYKVYAIEGDGTTRQLNVWNKLTVRQEETDVRFNIGEFEDIVFPTTAVVEDIELTGINPSTQRPQTKTFEYAELEMEQRGSDEVRVIETSGAVYGFSGALIKEVYDDTQLRVQTDGTAYSFYVVQAQNV